MPCSWGELPLDLLFAAHAHHDCLLHLLLLRAYAQLVWEILLIIFGRDFVLAAWVAMDMLGWWGRSHWLSLFLHSLLWQLILACCHPFFFLSLLSINWRLLTLLWLFLPQPDIFSSKDVLVADWLLHISAGYPFYWIVLWWPVGRPWSSRLFLLRYLNPTIISHRWFDLLSFCMVHGWLIALAWPAVLRTWHIFFGIVLYLGLRLSCTCGVSWLTWSSARFDSSWLVVYFLLCFRFGFTYLRIIFFSILSVIGVNILPGWSNGCRFWRLMSGSYYVRLLDDVIHVVFRLRLNMLGRWWGSCAADQVCKVVLIHNGSIALSTWFSACFTRCKVSSEVRYRYHELAILAEFGPLRTYLFVLG